MPEVSRILTKRIYDPPDPADGFRLLVMRRWPRGIRKGAVDAWERDLGPSPDLLGRWRGGKLSWEEYCQEYVAQLRGQPALVERVGAIARDRTLTLLCSCKDADHCHRTLLKHVLEETA